MKDLREARSKVEAESVSLDTEERKLFNYLVNERHNSIEAASNYINERRRFTARYIKKGESYV